MREIPVKGDIVAITLHNNICICKVIKQEPSGLFTLDLGNNTPYLADIKELKPIQNKNELTIFFKNSTDNEHKAEQYLHQTNLERPSLYEYNTWITQMFNGVRPIEADVPSRLKR